MILGPDDPRAIKGKELEEARANTEKWNEYLGIKPLTKKQKAAKKKQEEEILKLIGWEEMKLSMEDIEGLTPDNSKRDRNANTGRA